VEPSAFQLIGITPRDSGNLRLFRLPPYNSTIKRTCVFLKLTELIRTSLFVQPPTLLMCGPESPDDPVLLSVKNISPSPHLQLQLRFLDPTLSVSSFPLPGIEHQLEGATSNRVFLPVMPVSDWLRISSAFLIRPFRYPLSRCPGSSISWEVLPVTGFFFR
jgi:hypothetical protein